MAICPLPSLSAALTQSMPEITEIRTNELTIFFMIERYEVLAVLLEGLY